MTVSWMQDLKSTYFSRLSWQRMYTGIRTYVNKMFYAVTVNAKYVITAYKMQIFVVFWQT
jgi:hypothetical protein